MITETPFCIIQPGKDKSLTLAKAVISGCGGGEVHYGNIPVEAIPEHMTPVVIGVHLATIDTLHALRHAQRPFVTVDNGYFKPYKEGGFFRATTNALQWITSQRGIGFCRDVDCTAEGESRFKSLGLEIKPWRKDNQDGHILIPLQSPIWLEMMGEFPTWLQSVQNECRAYQPDRPIVVREKPLKGAPWQPSLEEHLAGAWGVIGYSTNVLIKSVMEGIPSCSLAFCAASPICQPVIPSLFLGPKFRDREPILYNLAANQWTIDEITSGKMWRDLQSRYEPTFPRLA